MTPLPSAPNVIKLSHVFNLGEAANARSHLFVGYSSAPPDATDLNSLCLAAGVSWASEFAGYLITGYDFLGVEAVDLSSPSGAFGSHPVVVAGSRAGAVPGGQAQTLIEMKVARRYRGGKPKSFWPMGSGDDVTGPNTWNPAFIVNLNVSLATYLAVIFPVTFGALVTTGLVNVSYYGPPHHVITNSSGRVRNSSTLRSAPVVEPIVSTLFVPKLASQRRRRTLSP